MKEIDFLDAVGRVDKQYIEECITYTPPKQMNVWIRRMSTIAACFLVVIGAVLIINHLNQPVIIDENGFYIEDGVLLRYTGSETDVTIPEEVETIADFTFLENTNRTKIEVVRLGASVQKVETNAFAGLENLVDIIIAANNLSFVEEDGLLMTSDKSILLQYKREGETKFTIPESVRFVAAHAVQATELEEIDFGNIEYIGYNAFASNTKLKAIYLPDSVKYICEGAFHGCSSAVDGYIPQGAEIYTNAFYCVPFYHSILAGQMCPGEKVKRGLITPSEAILKSYLYSLTEQLTYLLASLNGDEDYVPSDEAKFGSAATYDLPSIPDGMIVPRSVELFDYVYKDNGWDGIGSAGYHIQIHIPAGNYNIVVQGMVYGLYDSLYWPEVRFRLSDVFYLENDITDSPDNAASEFGWSIIPEKKGDSFSGFTLIHEDGTVIHHNCPYRPTEPYRFIFSPSGTRLAVEYKHPMGHYSFYVLSLNGDMLDTAVNPSKETQYMNRYYGEYQGGTLCWVDEDNIEAINVYGKFRFNLQDFYETKVTYIEDETASLTKETSVYSRRCEVTLTVPLVWDYDGSFFDDMTRKRNGLSYENRAQLWETVGSNDRDGVDKNGEWKPNEIINAGAYFDMTLLETGTNANGFDYMMFLETGMGDPLVKYYVFFRYEGKADFAFWVKVYDDEDREAYLESVIIPILHSVSITPKSTAGENFDCLGMTVAELRENYGTLTFEYSEYGPGQPVYSAENLPGVLFVFWNHDMNMPLTDDMTPSELIITRDYAKDVHGLSVDYYMQRGIPWKDVEYNEMNGMEVTWIAEYDNYVLTVVAYDTYPEYPSDEEAVTAWKELLLEVEGGWVRSIRITPLQ